MAIDIVKQLVIPAGVGALDSFMEDRDVKAGKTEAFKKDTDYYRLGLVVLGFGGPMVVRGYDRYLDAISIAGATLLAKTLYTAARKTGTASRAGSYVERRRAIPAPAGNPMGRNVAPAFENADARVW